MPFVRNFSCSILKLCLITNIQNRSKQDYLYFLKQAIEGGITMVQLREKDPHLAYERALWIHSLLKKHHVPLIINDFIEIAKEIDADGVHLGPTDHSPDYARKFLGQNKIIGLSVEDETALSAANQSNAIDYVTASAVYPSKSKPFCNTYWGAKGLKRVIENAKHPVTAIGGINHLNASTIAKQGAKGIAVIGAIHDSNNTIEAARTLLEQLELGSSCYPSRRMR